MARTAPRPAPAITHELTPQRVTCPHCRTRMRAGYANRRTVAMLDGRTRLPLLIRRCHHVGRTAHETPYRPEAEGRLALPRHEFGLDVIALVGRLRYPEHRSVPERRARLAGRGLAAASSTGTTS